MLCPLKLTLHLPVDLLLEEPDALVVLLPDLEKAQFLRGTFLFQDLELTLQPDDLVLLRG